MNFDEVMEYMENTVNPLGSILGLSVMEELLDRLGHPERDLKVIHVAGTNGKGSISSFIAGALMANGYKVGRYISPSVLDYREKIQVNGTYIPKTKVAEYLSSLFEIGKEMAADGFHHPTAFELETAMAFLYLRDKKVDFAIIEVGMGGKDDATNVIPTPLLAVIASISLDHVGLIGNTLEEIAETKAGIIKDGGCVVVAPQEECVEAVLRRICAERANVSAVFTDNAQIAVKEPKSQIKENALPLPKPVRFTYGKTGIKLSVCGVVQAQNAATAYEAVKQLEGLGVKLKEEKTLKGIEQTTWPGRFEILGKKPPLIIDGAHNPDAVKRLMESVDFYFTNCPIIYIMGVLKDKAVEEMVQLCADRAKMIITVTPPRNQRAMRAYDLAGIIRAHNPHVTAADSVEEALEEAILLSGGEAVILAFGSLSYMGRIREAYEMYIKQSKSKSSRGFGEV